MKTNREVGLSVRSGNKEKTIDNDFQTTVKWNEEKIESESQGEVFAKDGNILKQGFTKERINTSTGDWKMNSSILQISLRSILVPM